MIFAYADPPYLGCGKLYRMHHPDAMDWDDIKTHQCLIERLCDEYVDGWVMSLSVPSLKSILPLCPEECRVGAWVKPFCSFKPGVTTAYAWEPVIWRGGRKRSREQETIRDWVSAPITLQKGLPGVKPWPFCEWVLDLLNVDEKQDKVDDLFPGSGSMGRAFDARRRAKQLNMEWGERACIAPAEGAR